MSGRGARSIRAVGCEYLLGAIGPPGRVSGQVGWTGRGYSAPPSTSRRPPKGGYYFTRAVVTFNDHVAGQDRLFVQDAIRGLLISLEERKLDPPLEVGQTMEIGGPLFPRKFGLGITPAAVNVFGWQTLPAPYEFPAVPSSASYQDGRWTEFEALCVR